MWKYYIKYYYFLYYNIFVWSCTDNLRLQFTIPCLNNTVSSVLCIDRNIAVLMLKKRVDIISVGIYIFLSSSISLNTKLTMSNKEVTMLESPI